MNKFFIMKTLKFFVLLFVAVAMSCNFVAAMAVRMKATMIRTGMRMTRMIPMTEQSTRSSL